MALSAGVRLGPYEIQSLIGSGGMGEVYRARDTRLDRLVAIKVVTTGLTPDPAAISRLEQEARAAAALNHPNILAVFDVGAYNSQPFIVSELLEGETLRARLQHPVPPRKALEWASQVADALSAAHARGIIHRDVKPENLFLTADGRVKVLDFGLSKLVEPHGPPAVTAIVTAPVQTAHGVVMGTVGYMSPEQVAGGVVDSRSDIFSLGVVLHELLTRQRAFQRGTSAETMTAILHDELPAPSTVNPSAPTTVDPVVIRCVEKSPAVRFQSASDLAFALRNASTASPSSGSDTVPHRATPGARWTIALAAGAVLCAVAGAAGARYLFRSATSPARIPKHFAVTTPAVLSEEPVPLAISADGTKLAYTAGTQEGSQLYVRALDRLDPVVVPGTLSAKNPFFSPDGRWIGFRAKGALKRVPAGGGPVVTIASLSDRGSVGAHWSADGTIYYSFAGSLWRVSSDGGTPQRLTTPDPARGELLHMWPQVLPGSARLLFTVVTSLDTDSSRLVVMPIGGGTPRTVLEGASYGHYLPTGHLVYLKSGTLFAVQFDVARLALSGSPTAVLDKLTNNYDSASAQLVAADEGTIAFVEGTRLDHRSLVWADRHGTSTPISADSDIPPRQFASPVVSFNGARIAALVRDKGQSDVWVYERATHAFGRLTLDGAIAGGLAWTADGKRVTFAKSVSGRSLIASQAVDGDRQSTTIVSATESLWVGGWSADGRFLGYMRAAEGTNGDVEAIDIKGDLKPRPVVSTPATEWGARLSPDGHWMAYTSNASGRWEVYVQPFPGPGNPRQISVDGGTEVVWAKNGHEIYFRNGTRMMFAPVVSTPEVSLGAPTVLFDAPFVMGQPGLPNYDVSTDGRFLMVQPGPEETAARPIHVVVDWFEDLKARVPTK